MRDFDDCCYDAGCPFTCGGLSNNLEDAKSFRCPLGCARNCSYVSDYYDNLKAIFDDSDFDLIHSFYLDCINNS